MFIFEGDNNLWVLIFLNFALQCESSERNCSSCLLKESNEMPLGVERMWGGGY